jgi:hypothetical protein
MHAAIWVLEVGVLQVGKPPYCTFHVMAGFWPALPGPDQVAAMRPSEQPHPGGLLPGYENVWKGWSQGAVPEDFAIVGQRALSAKERASVENASGTMVFQDGEHLRSELYRHWRWIHDREALEAEWARASAAREARAAERRTTLTLPKLLRERLFASAPWRPSVLRDVRRVFRDAIRELIALEKGGTKRRRIAALKRIVSDLNALDDGEGFIETPEREAFVARIEELARLVGVDNEDERLTGHRDW